MNPSILITGRSGQLGGSLATLLPEARALGHHEFDLSQPQELPRQLDAWQPKVIFNAAAYTAVDQAERERDVAFAVNAHAVETMAQWCASHGATLVHFSTDYVFPGGGDSPWSEEDLVAPLNIYGQSKLAGEQAITRSGCRHLVFRTSWVYDAFGRNFFNTMLRLGQSRESLTVVDDQLGAPTYAPHLANWALQALRVAEKQSLFPSGIYHLCPGGETSWFGFAQAIFTSLRAAGWPLTVEKVLAVSSAEYEAQAKPLAKRPLNSRLKTDKFTQTFSVSLPLWQQGLEECVKLRGRP